TGHSPTALSSRTRRESGQAGSRVESQSPGASDFSSSAAPAGFGSNTPVGDEPDRFRAWDSGQDAPGTVHDEESMMPPMPALGGMAATIAIGGLAYAWWRRRQARQTRMARLQAALMSLTETASGELPRMIGQAASQSKSVWLPLLLLPLALW